MNANIITTTEAVSLVPKHSINLSSSSFALFARLLSSVALAGVVTMGLFAVMHELIKQDLGPVAEPEPVVVISSILEIDETPTILKVPRPVMKELIIPPTLPAPIEQTPSNTKGFNPIINIPTKIGNKIAMQEMEVNQQPRPMVRVDPSYPSEAAQKGIEGYVTLSFGVSASGEINNIVIVEAQPRNVFNQAAKRALRKWRYQPRIEQGVAVAMQGLQVRLDFTLQNN